MAKDVGQGAGIVFGVSGWTGQFTAIRRSGESRPSVKTSDLSTTTADTFIPGDLVDRGSLDCDIQYDPDEPPPITSDAETVTLTFPVPAGSSNGATIAGTAFITEHDMDIPMDDLMTGSITIKWSGDVTFVDAS